jgi:hypothetical protein
MDKRLAELMATNPPVPLVGRLGEIRRLVAAMNARRSQLIVGPPGSGKTRLVREALRLAQQPSVTVRWPGVLHELLMGLAEKLGTIPKRSSSLNLKIAVLNALQRDPCCVILENAADAEPRVYRFLQHVFYVPRVCLIVTARSKDGLGHLGKLFFDPRERISLPSLTPTQARKLFDLAALVYQLNDLSLEEFRAKALAAAEGNPGHIVTMCRLAARPEYRHDGYIKFLPLRMDALCTMTR